MRLNDLPGPHSSLTRSQIPHRLLRQRPCSLEPAWIGRGGAGDRYTILDSPKASGSKRTLTPPFPTPGSLKEMRGEEEALAGSLTLTESAGMAPEGMGGKRS